MTDKYDLTFLGKESEMEMLPTPSLSVHNELKCNLVFIRHSILTCLRRFLLPGNFDVFHVCSTCLMAMLVK